MMTALLRAKELQHLVGKYMYEENPYTDIVRWKEMQQHFSDDISLLMKTEGSSPEEEAEIVLAVLMGYCVTMRNAQHVETALDRAERILPHLKDKVLKCHLMVFCYGEYPEESLADDIYRLIQELKAEGKGEEIRLVENLLENMA